jgi:mannose-1-phosphate guanylyltransferase/mannose-6-phosphate isomerase
MPKQFLPLAGDRTLFQNTLLRAKDAGLNEPMVVAAAEYRFTVERQMSELGISGDIILESEGRNTAPAILATAFHLAASDPQAIMIVLPSDHYMPDHQHFAAAVAAGVEAARSGKLVTFGIEPSWPETGFGYIKIKDEEEGQCFAVSAFHEKPDKGTAVQMLEDGGYLWNAGIFMVTVDTILQLAELHQMELYARVEDAMKQVTVDGRTILPDPDLWKLVPSESIDYAIAEKAQLVACVPLQGKWSDMGDWTSVLKTVEPDNKNNRLRGSVLAIGCSHAGLISTDENFQLVGLGLENVVAVATSDAVLVADASRMQEVKTVVDVLGAERAPQATQHKKDYRPWGWFESLTITDGYQVKRLHVYPGNRLSLQSHRHRSEHWVVVIGTATVTLEEDTFEIEENCSIYIGSGKRHRLANDTDSMLTVIEVQTGSYLGEDDIVRYDDDFDRSSDK